MLPLEIIRPLIFVLRCLAHNLHPNIPGLLDQVGIDGRINAGLLSNVEGLLIEGRRRDFPALQILQETLRGDYTRLHQTYRDLREIIFRFHNGRNPAPGPWCYLFTQNSLPLRQDTAGTTDHGNVFAAESPENERNLNNERYPNHRYPNNERQSHRQALHQRPQGRYHPQLEPQGDNRKNAQPTHSDSSLNRSPQTLQEEPDLPQLSGPFGEHPPEEPRQSRRCPTCGSRIQSMQNSYGIWSRISEMVMGLNSIQRQRFIREMHNYDPDILYHLQFSTFPTTDMINSFIAARLRQHHMNGNTNCVLCFLNYFFQRVGRGDLAAEVRHIRSRMR